MQLRAYIPSSGPTRSRVRRILRFLPEGFEFQCKHLHFVFSIFDEAHLSRLKFEQRQISMHAGKRISPRMRDESNSSKSESLSQICVDFLGTVVDMFNILSRHETVEKSLINDKAKLCNSLYFLHCLLNELGYI